MLYVDDSVRFDDEFCQIDASFFLTPFKYLSASNNHVDILDLPGVA